jgi:hypothetical protein
MGKNTPFQLSQDAEGRMTTAIDDNFTRLEKVINENIVPQIA